MLVRIWLATVVCCAVAARRPAAVHRFFQDLAGQLFYLDYSDTSGTTAFAYWAQNAGSTLIPLLRQMDHQFNRNVTVLVPSTGMFVDWVTSENGNFSDPETLSTPEWNAKWASVFGYFFVYGRTNLSQTTTNMSIILDTGKPSPVGDWPLQVAFSWNATKAADPDMLYNGTVSTSALTTADVTLGDVWVDSAVAQVINAWPVEPMGLSESLAALGFDGWPDVAQRTQRADLSRRNDYTLFVPPASAWLTAANASDATLSAFIDAHLFVGDLLVMPEDTEPAKLTMADGSSISASISAVTKAGRTASVVQRDILTNCGRLQLIDSSLYEHLNASKSALGEL